MPTHQARAIQMSVPTGCSSEERVDRVHDRGDRLVLGEPCDGAGHRFRRHECRTDERQEDERVENAVAPSMVLALRPAMMASHVRARVNSIRMPATASHASALAPVRKPIRNPTPKMIASEAVRDERGEHVGPQHARSGDRHGVEALEDAALQVVEQAVRRVGDAGRDGDEQDAGQQVVDVVLGADALLSARRRRTRTAASARSG